MEGSPDALKRKFILICNWQGAGRSAEVAWVTLDGLEFSPFFLSVFGEVPQSKVSEVKIVAFVAGVDRYGCFFTSFGDYLTTGVLNDQRGDVAWLFPDLQSTKSPGTTIGNYMKAVCPSSGPSSKYGRFIVPELPRDPCAAGIRPGVINTLASCMPGEFVAHTTGHKLTGIGALYEYLDADLALTMPGATVLAGFTPFPWGQLGKGPVPASFNVVMVDLAIDEAVVQLFVDELFRIDSASPPVLKLGGKLRGAVLSAAASLVMYYEVRGKAGEVSGVLLAMREAIVRALRNRTVSEAGSASALAAVSAVALAAASSSASAVLAVVEPAVGGIAHATLCQWGSVIKRRFDVDNFPSFGRTGHDTSHFTESFSQVGRSLGEATHASRELASRIDQMLPQHQAMQLQLSLLQVQVIFRINNLNLNLNLNSFPHNQQ